MRSDAERAAQQYPLPETLLVSKWPDAVVEDHGFPVMSSAYVETFWLPVLGPSSLWLLRRLVSTIELADGNALFDTELLSQMLGLGHGIGKHSILGRSVHRLVKFGAGQMNGPGDHLVVRTHLGTVPRGLRAGWPEFLQAAHIQHEVRPACR